MARASADAVLRAAGYRARGAFHHATLFEAVEELMPDRAAQIRHFDRVRDRRNTMMYKRPAPPTQAQADELLEQAREFLAAAVAWIRANHPKLLPPATP